MLNRIRGKIIAEGWLQEALKRDRDGITGYLDKICKDAAGDLFGKNKVADEYDGYWSSWWPGETEGNWHHAYTLLAFALDDPDMIARAGEIVHNYMANQDTDGYIGIFNSETRFSNGRRSGELWTQSRAMLTMLTYYQKTGEDAVLDALTRMADCIVRHYGPLAGGRSLYEVPCEDGSKTHSLMIAEPMLALFECTGKKEYLDFCVFLYDDYSAHEVEFPCGDLRRPLAGDPTVPLISHGPHTCEQLRIPLLLYHYTGRREYLALFLSAMRKMEENLGLAGSCKSDELIGVYQKDIPENERVQPNLGKCYVLPSNGYEYCSTTELMFSLLSAFSVTGDYKFADMEEWLVLNAAMAAKQADGKAIQYLCAENLYEATSEIGARWDYSPTHEDAAVCCAPNSGKVMPFHVENLWMQDGDELVAALYSPCRLETTMDGVSVRIRETTNYPFENRIRFTVETNAPVEFGIRFRIPRWSKGFRIFRNGEQVEGENRINALRSVVLSAVWSNGDVVELELLAAPELEPVVDGTWAVKYGPLLYALKIPEQAEPSRAYDLAGFQDIDYRPEPGFRWDYTLLMNPAHMNESLIVRQIETHAYPWEEPPVALDVHALSNWSNPMVLQFIPIGATTLRRTAFPAVLQTDKR